MVLILLLIMLYIMYNIYMMFCFLFLMLSQFSFSFLVLLQIVVRSHYGDSSMNPDTRKSGLGENESLKMYCDL